jgi:hypothetical protein
MPRWSRGETVRFPAAAALAAALIAAAAGPARAHSVPPLLHQPDVRFCVLDYGAPPQDRGERDKGVIDHARGEVIVYAGNLQKYWFPLTKRSDGKTVRDLHPGVKILQYMSAAEFPAVATANDAMGGASGPTAYARTRTFTVPEYLRIARKVGGKVPDLIDPKPYGFGDGILEFNLGPHTLRSNPGGADFIRHAVKYAAFVRKEGGDGVFLDNLSGTAWFLPGVDENGGDPIRLPPWCFKMKDGRYYWQHQRAGRPVPSLADLKAGKPEAIAPIASVDDCRATGAPAEWRTSRDLENAEIAFVRALKQSGPGLVMFNGLFVHQAEHALRVLALADGGMMEGFVLHARPAETLAAVELARRATKTGKWVILNDITNNPKEAAYSYAGYLLAAAPNVCWGGVGTVKDVPEMRVVLGPARGSYAVLPEGQGNPEAVVLYRRFERGEVFLNPQNRPMAISGATLPPRSGLVRPFGFADAR